MTEATVQICLRGDTAANWAAKNPILDKNEVGIVEGTPLRKTGDGITPWNQLPYDFVALLANEIPAEHAAAAGLELRPLLIYILNHMGSPTVTGVKPPAPTNPEVDDVADTFTYYPGGYSNTGLKPAPPTYPLTDDTANTLTYYPSGAAIPATPTSPQTDDSAHTLTYTPSS
jgi:hypothetical protein